MKKFLNIFVVLIFVVFAFVGCGKQSYKSMADLPVVGNGGLCVAKGDYIYFVNGYASKAQNLNKNKEGKITTSGIYRVKTSNCAYQINDGILTLDNGTVALNENSKVEGAELIVSKVCGFENTALYIFGDYIYYTTPNNQVAKDGTVYYNDIDFCRARLDGENNKVLGTISVSESNYSKTELAFYCLNNEVYFACYNGDQTLTIDKITEKKTTRVSTLENVSNVFLPQINENYVGRNSKPLDNTIFYTVGKNLCSISLSDLTNKTLKTFSASETLTIIGNNGTNLYYKVEQNDLSTIIKNSCPSYFPNGETVITSGGTSFTSFSILDGSDSIIATTASKIYLLNTNGEIEKEFAATSAEIIATNNRNIIYISSGNLYKVNLFDTTPTATLLANNFSLNTSIVRNFSISNEFVYYFKTLEDGSIFVEMINFHDLNSDGNIKVSQILSV